MGQSIKKLLFTGQTVANTTLDSDKIDITNFNGCGIQADLTGAGSTGTIKVQASNNGTTWGDVSGATAVIAGAGTHFFNIGSMYHSFLRLRVISTNVNTITCNALAIAKD